MSLWAVLQIAEVAQHRNKERKLRELLRKKGVFRDDMIDYLVGLSGILWLDENKRQEVFRASGLSREEYDSRVNNAFLLMFQFEDVAQLIIGDKKKAKEAHLQARAIRKQMIPSEAHQPAVQSSSVSSNNSSETSSNDPKVQELH
jgi:hypothetical protein